MRILARKQSKLEAKMLILITCIWLDKVIQYKKLSLLIVH